MRAAMIDENSIVINYVEVNGFGNKFINPLDSVIGSYWNGESFIPPSMPDYPPETPEQAYLEYLAMINRRADALEESGDQIGALLLRMSLTS